jgi:outer membrane lipopolysaccharide assembly protein LptE/RlpB
MTRSIILSGAALLTLLAGCQFHARDAESYRKITREQLESRNADIKACYDRKLAQHPDADLSATVVVNFIVEKDTGVIKDFKIDEKESKGNEGMQRCVLSELEGKDLKIDPPDAREGHATFRWEFSTNKS